MACTRTFATLRVFSPEITVGEITCELGIEPSRAICRDVGSCYKHVREFNHWRWSTEGIVSQLDAEAHIFAVCAMLRGKLESLDALRKQGCEVDVFCFWEFSNQGAINLSLNSMRSLLELGLEVTWDVDAREVAKAKQSEKRALQVGGV